MQDLFFYQEPVTQLRGQIDAGEQFGLVSYFLLIRGYTHTHTLGHTLMHSSLMLVACVILCRDETLSVATTGLEADQLSIATKLECTYP